MNEKQTAHPSEEEIPEAIIEERKNRFSIVWFIPLAALVIGGWLVWKSFSEKGPAVTISFKSADGLEAGKTKIKYKDVEIGQVEKIRLAEDLSHVEVTANFVKDAEHYISENTRFWVVRARVAAGEVSGLSTLFSGAYIGIDPGKPGKTARKFKGLEIPPVVTADLPGAHFALSAPAIGSLDIGSPVYYRQIRVGQVVAYHLDEAGNSVNLKVFIEAPHHKRVRKNTHFWNAGGMDFVLDANGIRVNTESIITLMIGGIAFDTPGNLEPGEPAGKEDVFPLYKTRRSISERNYVKKNEWLMYFDGSVRGLAPGAPVELKGIRIGQVKDVSLKFDFDRQEIRIPVLVEIEEGRITHTGTVPPNVERDKIMDYMVEKGLRAQLRTGSLITGQLLVSLDFHPDAPAIHISREGRHPEFPTIPAPLEEMTTSLSHLLSKLEQVPIEQIGRELGETVRGAKNLVNSEELKQSLTLLNETISQLKKFAVQINSEMSPELKKAASGLNDSIAHLENTLKQLDNKIAPQLNSTLTGIGSFVSKDSAIYGDMKRMMVELADAARSIRLVADYLERHPESLIYGKDKKQ
ncbi:MAG: intermembrane transport protein PqiB [Desulfococcaceae bacterium]